MKNVALKVVAVLYCLVIAVVVGGILKAIFTGLD